MSLLQLLTVNRGIQDVRDERIRIQRDRRQHRVELALAEAALGVRTQRSDGEGECEKKLDRSFHASNVDLALASCCINV